MKRLMRMMLPLALSAAPVAAQSLHYGFQVGANFAQSDLKTFTNQNATLTVGVNLPIDLGEGHVIRPRLDYARYSESNAQGTQGLDDKATSMFLGADYLYYPAQQPKGFYFVAGLGYDRVKFEQSFAGLSDDTTKGNLGWGAGAGWQFTDLLGAELRYTSSHISTGGAPMTFAADAINASVTFKF